MKKFAKTVVSKTNKYVKDIAKKGKISTNVFSKNCWKMSNTIKFRTFATQNMMTKLNTKWLLGGAVIIAAGLIIQNEAFSAEGVDYAKLRADLEDLIESAFKKNPMYDDGSYGPLFVRLAWHAAGTYSKHDSTGGSNGANMRFHPEAGHGANAGLGLARDLLEPIKKKYPGISYADLYTFAGVVAIESMGGPKIPWRAGRSDTPSEKEVKPTPSDRLPDAAQGSDHIRFIFCRMGFDDREIVALAGAHALGRCHTDRSGFSGPWTRSPTSFTNAYFQELLNNKWTQKKWNGPIQFEDPTGELMMLPADLAFRDDKEFRKWVELYAKDQDAFFADFSKAFAKLLELGVSYPVHDTHAQGQLWKKTFN